MFRMNGMPRAQGCAGAACFSFAQYPANKTFCPLWGFAPHIPVLYREVPFILNITLCYVRNHGPMVSDR